MTNNNSNGGGVEVAEVSRKIFTVELRQGETTIVSWKKLLKDAARAAGEASTSSPSSSSSLPSAIAASSQPPPPATTHSNPLIAPPLPPGQSADNELKDGHPSRFGAVIQKIERLYMGKHSSDEEDLNDVPDDDEYDTEDSFIDDAELDDYFQVDNSAIKHDGFFVNRGKLERKNDPTSLPSQQAKKRRRKDLVVNNSHELPNKLVKVGNGADRKFKKLVKKNISIPHVVALPSPRCEEMNLHNQTNTSVTCAKRKSTETKTSLAPSITSNVEMLDASLLKSYDKSVLTKIKSGPTILSNINGELDQSVQGRDKEGNLERLDLNVSTGKVPKQNQKAPVLHRKEGSGIKPKSAVLEKTIGELEKMVTESRPPSMELQDDETSQGAGKRRLPQELKQKLAKVARLAEAIHGRIPDELVNRLMSILGHLLQVKTLKRNLKDMVTMGLIAKKEKDDRVQQMKKDVSELIKIRVPYIKSKIIEHQAGESGDFQEMTKEEKDIIKRKYGMDNALEDKISELYDLYVDSLDEDAGPQARRLYAELAHLWPEGFMDNHGIKRAICRAKDRRRSLYGRSEDQENIKKKKLVANTEGTVRADASSVALPHHTQEKLLSEPNTHGLISSNKPLVNTTSTNSSVILASSSPDAPNRVHPKQNKAMLKSSFRKLNEKVQMDVLGKKKMNRKPETEIIAGQTREKPVSLSGYERGKSHKQDVGPLQRPSASFSPPVNLNNPSNMS